MILKKLTYYLLIAELVLICSCKEKYFPPTNQAITNFLVADGTLINGPDSTYMRLGRTKKLDDTSPNWGNRMPA